MAGSTGNSGAAGGMAVVANGAERGRLEPGLPPVSPGASTWPTWPSCLDLIIEYDPLRDDGQAYAERLAAAGVPTTATCLVGPIHGFLGFGGSLAQTAELVDLVVGALKT